MFFVYCTFPVVWLILERYNNNNKLKSYIMCCVNLAVYGLCDKGLTTSEY